jgi:hypothetical protein
VPLLCARTSSAWCVILDLLDVLYVERWFRRRFPSVAITRALHRHVAVCIRIGLRHRPAIRVSRLV